MDIKTILAPVDFSAPSQLATDCAIPIARRLRARLVLLHVVESPTVYTYTFPVTAEAAQQRRHEQAARMLCALVAPEDQDDLDVQIRIRHGHVQDEIRHAIRAENAGLAVMGTHGRGLFGEWLIGSVAQNLLRNMSVPTMTVAHLPRPMALSRILFATDFSDASNDAFTLTLDLAKAWGGKVTVLHSVEAEEMAYGGAIPLAGVAAEKEYRIGEARKKMADLSAEATRRDVGVETFITDGDAGTRILETADRSDADAIVIGIEKKGMVYRVMLGTTAERVVREAHIPVLSVPLRVAESSNEADYIEQPQSSHPSFLFG